MKVGIIGLGLIGGSLGRAIRNKTNDQVYAFDISDGAMVTGKLVNAYEFPLTPDSVSQLDVIFFSLYPSALENALSEYVPKLKKGALVVDCCGNKRRVTAQMKGLAQKYPDLEFIGAHPMAGREFSGVGHSTNSLFERASMILVPVKAEIGRIAWLKEYALSLGFGEVVITTAEKHDEIIAFTSQLAHLVSSSYIKSDRATEYMGFSAGSFRDMTRVAKLSPTMWAELTLDNADFLVDELDSFIKHLKEYKEALQNKDFEQMKNLLADGNMKKIQSEKLKKVRK